MAPYLLPKRHFYPGNIDRLKNLIPANWRVIGLSLLVPRICPQPFEEPALGFAQLRGGFFKRKGSAHRAICRVGVRVKGPPLFGEGRKVESFEGFFGRSAFGEGD